MKLKKNIWYYGGIVCIAVALIATITGAVTSNGTLFVRGLFALGIFIFLFLRFARGHQVKEEQETAPEQEKTNQPKT